MYLVCSPFIIYERGEKMSQFEGLTDSQWLFLASLVPQEPEKRSKEYPHASWRKVCHSIFWILITGSRWCDLPKGEAWGARTTSHSRLGVWQEDGTLDAILSAGLSLAELKNLFNWERIAGDGFVFRR